jgi:hypothetical protein
VMRYTGFVFERRNNARGIISQTKKSPVGSF